MDEQMIIRTRNLTKSFKEVKVLNGINLSVEKGHVFALLGSNGAGKTTTIRILSTLLKPDSGEVELAGFSVVKEPKEVIKHIALTGQYAAVDGVLTGRENLNMMGALLNIEKRKETVEKLLTQFDLLAAADRQVSTYSGGMRRKLDIAMSLIGNPSVIFLDEPTTGLDPQSRKTMWKMIKALSSKGVTIFLTTQYLDEAEALADKIVILDKGKIIAEGTNEELKDIIASNVITLTFKNEEDTLKAKLLLQEFSMTMDQNSNELKIEIHDSINEMMLIFQRLKNGKIEVVNFEKKNASLEDVFLELIEDDNERSMKNAVSY